MAGSLSGVAPPAAAPTHWKAIQRRKLIVRRVRATSLVVLVATVILLAWDLYDRPAHPYQVGANSAAWSADVTTALAKSPSGGHFVPVGALRVVPGVGKIVDVIVDKGPHKWTAVLFLTGLGVRSNYAGLVYLDGFPPLADSCNFHLGGPWWEVSPLNVNTCARGFHFTGGG